MVQRKRGIPFIYLIKHLNKQPTLQKGEKITARLVIHEKKLKVIIDLE